MTTQNPEILTAEEASRLPAVIVVNPLEGLAPDTAKAISLYGELLLATVSDEVTAATVGGMVKQLRIEIKNIEADIKPRKDQMKAAHQSVCDFEKEQTAPFKKVADEAQGRIDTWLREEDRRRREAALRLQQEKAKEAEEERERLARAAAEMEELGQGEAAAAIREDAERVVAAPAFVPSSSPAGPIKGAGATLSTGKKLVVTVTNKKAFLRYLVEKESAAVFVEFKQRELEAWVRTQDFQPGDVPGLHIEHTVKSSIR